MLEHGTEGCNYLLAVDVDMNTVAGYAISSWEKGYGDMVFVLDLDTIRLLPHLPGTVMIQCDLALADGAPVRESPRAILRAQVERAAALGWTALAGTELEFIVFDTHLRGGLGARLPRPDPGEPVQRRLLDPRHGRVEPLLRDIRNTMYAAGLNVESAKGECNFGQHEIALPVRRGARHRRQPRGLQDRPPRRSPHQHGQAITFMAKTNEREGNSCHIHLSLRGHGRRRSCSGMRTTGARTPLYDHFIAGVLATMREFTLLYAPNINSYKRFAEGSFAPTAVAWGLDNRTCAVRLVGHGPSARMENRLPGGDVNPYLALAAMLAGGLLRHRARAAARAARPAGNAYTSDKPTRADAPCARRATRSPPPTIAREAFGDEVVDHYMNMADVELAAFDAAVTDWELAPRIREDVRHAHPFVTVLGAAASTPC